MREQHPLVTQAIEAGVDARVGWKRDDPTIGADAKALWKRLSVLPANADLDQRTSEIVAIAYVDGEAAGVATAFIREIEFLRAKFAMFRCAVAPEHRRRNVMRVLLNLSLDTLSQWSLEHPDEAVMGMATVTQNAEIGATKLPGVMGTTGLVLVGYTEAGDRIRVAWFDHARV